MFKNWNHYKTAAVFFAIWLIAVSAFALYNATTASGLDETRPPDTGESARYGAAAIREIKRVFKNWLAVEHYLSGAHKTNFFQQYMAGTNSIHGSAISNGTLSGSALINGSVPVSALQNVSSNVMRLVAYQEFTTNRVISGANSTFTINNTVPVITRGQEVFSATVRPSASNATLIVQASLQGDSYGQYAVAALFTNGVTNAVAAVAWQASLASEGSLLKRLTPGSTNAVTVSLRAGANSGTLNLNGTGASAQIFGNSALCSFMIYEVVP